MLAAAGLAVALAVQIALPVRTATPDGPSRAPRRPRLPVPAMIPDYPAILKVPVFAPDRKPAGEGGGVQGMRLVGVAAFTREAASAVVQAPDGSTHVLKPGETLSGWTLVSVAPDRAVFAGPAGRFSLPLGPPAPPAGQAPASVTP